MSDTDGELNFERRRYPRFNVSLPVEFTIVAEQRRCRAALTTSSARRQRPLRHELMRGLHAPAIGYTISAEMSQELAECIAVLSKNHWTKRPRFLLLNTF